MEKLTVEEVAELAEKGRILYEAEKGVLDPKDYAAYYIYKRQEEERKLELFKVPIQSSSTNMVVSSRKKITSSLNNSGGKYVRKKTLLNDAIAIKSDTLSFHEWNISLAQWLDEKIQNLNREFLLYKIVMQSKRESQQHSIPTSIVIENVFAYSHELIQMVQSLYFRGKRACRSKGSQHKVDPNLESTNLVNESSRKEFISILNESILFFNRASPSSTTDYSLKMKSLLNLIMEKIFYQCYPINDLENITLKEVKEAHKNSSAAFRRFTEPKTDTVMTTTSTNESKKRKLSTDQSIYMDPFMNIHDQSNEGNGSMDQLNNFFLRPYMNFIVEGLNEFSGTSIHELNNDDLDSNQL